MFCSLHLQSLYPGTVLHDDLCILGYKVSLPGLRGESQRVLVVFGIHDELQVRNVLLLLSPSLPSSVPVSSVLLLKALLWKWLNQLWSFRCLLHRLTVHIATSRGKCCLREQESTLRKFGSVWYKIALNITWLFTSTFYRFVCKIMEGLTWCILVTKSLLKLSTARLRAKGFSLTCRNERSHENNFPEYIFRALWVSMFPVIPWIAM